MTAAGEKRKYGATTECRRLTGSAFHRDSEQLVITGSVKNEPVEIGWIIEQIGAGTNPA